MRVLLLLLLLSLIYCSARRECDSPFKVYVYELPPSLVALAENARKTGEYHVCKKCIYEQFALEYIVYDYFTQHCGRTTNPDEADFFYLPVIREIDYRIALGKGGNRAPSLIEQALLATMENYNFTKWDEVFNVTHTYWQQSNGSDHVIVMPAPVTNFRHQTNMRGFFHYMIHLNDPIFLNVEYSHSFTQEYPICATEKNIVMPYPTIDSDFYAGKWFLPGFPNIKRDKLIFYLGGNHGSCVFIREALTGLSRDRAIAIQRGPRKREEGFQSATFCPIPIGDSPSSKRMYDVLNYGCIPVVLSDELVWAYSTDTGGPLEPSHFSIQLPQSVVLKSAETILSKYVPSALQANAKGNPSRQSPTAGSHRLMNRGRRLPSGASVVDLLREIVEEDRVAAQASANSTGLRRLTAHLSSDEQERLDQSHRYLLGAAAGGGKGKGQQPAQMPPIVKGAAATSIPQANTLIRLLHKISAADIALLQAGVRNASQHYQYYAMDANMRTDVTPPAVHAYPDGGAMRMLDRLLAERKQRGVRSTHERCQAERHRKGHKYIGNYPCEKR